MIDSKVSQPRLRMKWFCRERYRQPALLMLSDSKSESISQSLEKTVNEKAKYAQHCTESDWQDWIDLHSL